MEKYDIEKKKLAKTELPCIPRNIVSDEKPDKKDIVKKQNSRFAIWCLIIFATRFHIIILYLHFLFINAFI